MCYCILILWILCCLCGCRTAANECVGGAPVTGGGCSYQRFASVKSKNEAEGCCSGPQTVLAPVIDQLAGFSVILNGATGPHFTSLYMRSSQVYIGDEIVDVSGKWKNGVPSEENIECIAAESVTVTQFVIFPANCSDEMSFICLSAINSSCHCSVDEECVADFTHVCAASCQVTPTTTTAPTTDQSTSDPNTTSSGKTTGQSTTDPATTSSGTTTSQSTTATTSSGTTITQQSNFPVVAVIFSVLGGCILIFAISCVVYKMRHQWGLV